METSTTTKSNLILNNRNELQLTGVKKVRSSEPDLIVANLDNGNIVINGNNLSVQELNIKEGTLSVQGTVNGIKYSANVSKSFSIKNMFR